MQKKAVRVERSPAQVKYVTPNLDYLNDTLIVKKERKNEWETTEDIKVEQPAIKDFRMNTDDVRYGGYDVIGQWFNLT